MGANLPSVVDCNLYDVSQTMFIIFPKTKKDLVVLSRQCLDLRLRF